MILGKVRGISYDLSTDYGKVEYLLKIHYETQSLNQFFLYHEKL